MARHCLKIPFLIGQRDDAIIGHACADNPAWEVPCSPVSVEGVACSDLILPEAAGQTAGLGEAEATPLLLTAPTDKALVLA